MGSILNIIATLFQVFWAIVKFPLFAVILVGFLFFAMFLFQCGLEYKNGSRLQKGEHRFVKRPGFFKTFLCMAPRQYAKDFFSRNPDDFRYKGCIIFTGEQGSGKTIAMVEQAMRFQEEYPKVKVLANLDYKYQDDTLSDWRQLVSYKNGTQGVVVLMDELQNWFSSNQSKNFPPQMLEVVTQNRKNRRIILGTSQVFNRMAKPLREQTSEERSCWTLFNCVTIVRRRKPILDSEGNVDKWKLRGFYYFAHTPEIREAYDTYQAIESLANSGFADKPLISLPA